MSSLNILIENWELIFGILGSALGLAYAVGRFVTWCKMSIGSMNDRISSIEKELKGKSFNHQVDSRGVNSE